MSDSEQLELICSICGCPCKKWADEEYCSDCIPYKHCEFCIRTFLDDVNRKADLCPACKNKLITINRDGELW